LREKRKKRREGEETRERRGKKEEGRRYMEAGGHEVSLVTTAKEK